MERELIEWLCEQVPGGEAARIGIGDDAAVLAWQQRGDLVVTTDLLIDHVHFELSSETDVRRIGRKSLAVNLSDLAAMAVQPVAAVVSLALPRTDGMKLAKTLYEGLLPLATEFDCLIVGGDTNSHDGPLVVSVTALGEPTSSGVWPRSGARAGDRLLVSGQLGGSRFGKHLDFTPRVKEALQLGEKYKVHAAMDLSDGLSLDLTRLVAASNCGATLIAPDIPISTDALRASHESGHAPLEHALSDGEDFELLLAVAPQVAEAMLREQPLDVPLTEIGWITAEQTLRIVDEHGTAQKLRPTGYEHKLDA